MRVRKSYLEARSSSETCSKTAFTPFQDLLFILISTHI